MSDRIKLVSGDTRPQVYVALYDKSSKAPIDLSQVDLIMNFRAQGSTTILAALVGQKLPGTVDPVTGAVDDAAAAVGVGGRAVFNWPAAALDVAPGYYDGEIILTFSDGTVQTIYDLVKFKVRAPGG
jgi:hypothetical protein